MSHRRMREAEGAAKLTTEAPSDVQVAEEESRRDCHGNRRDRQHR